MNNITQLPVYKLVIDDSQLDETGVNIVSLVKFPAIERPFQVFSKTEESKRRYRFDIQNTARRIVSGPIMIPDMPIYREEAGQSYYVYFDKETIYQIVQKYFKTKSTSNVNAEHSGPLLDGVYQFESFIIDGSRGIMPPLGYDDLPDGTWFGSWKVDNDQIFADIMAGRFSGFSVEGYFDYSLPTLPAPVESSPGELFKEMRRLLNEVEA